MTPAPLFVTVAPSSFCSMGGTVKDMKNLTPGWYRDPVRPNEHLHWNGESWDEPLTQSGRLPRQVDARGAREQRTATGAPDPGAPNVCDKEPSTTQG